jgi:hypothetical protein
VPLPSNTLSITGDCTSRSYQGSQMKDGFTAVSGSTGWVGVVAGGASSTLSFGSTTTFEQIELIGMGK